MTKHKEKIYKYEPKPLFEERMKALLKDEKDYQEFLKISKTQLQKTIRANKLKTNPEKLKKQLEAKGWKIKQPFKEAPEIMIVTSKLEPGELGSCLEHQLGLYYVQEISSMLPILALSPKPEEIMLDLCASPGSKTTQTCSEMDNQGTIIANDKDIGRIAILSTNLERCGCSNILVSRNDGVQLCERLNKIHMKFDKILVDAPCSGEGTLRSSPKTFLMWNHKLIKKFSRTQKKLAASVIPLLNKNSTLVYSTCTHAPEENEIVVDFLIKNFNLQLEEIKLPSELKTRPGITEWQNEKLSPELKKCVRLYPQDNNTEGFFLAKLKKT